MSTPSTGRTRAFSMRQRSPVSRAFMTSQFGRTRGVLSNLCSNYCCYRILAPMSRLLLRASHRWGQCAEPRWRWGGGCWRRVGCVRCGWRMWRMLIGCSGVLTIGRRWLRRWARSWGSVRGRASSEMNYGVSCWAVLPGLGAALVAGLVDFRVVVVVVFRTGLITDEQVLADVMPGWQWRRRGGTGCRGRVTEGGELVCSQAGSCC